MILVFCCRRGVGKYDGSSIDQYIATNRDGDSAISAGTQSEPAFQDQRIAAGAARSSQA